VQMILAADAVTAICRELNYSRAHVQTKLRQHSKRLRARKRGRLWSIPEKHVSTLREIVLTTSGRRYKLGERGPHGTV